MSNSPPQHAINGDDIEAMRSEDLGLKQTSTMMTISPELFEKLYLTPKTPHTGDSYKRFGMAVPENESV
jgi:hypothetical protein